MTGIPETGRWPAIAGTLLALSVAAAALDQQTARDTVGAPIGSAAIAGVVVSDGDSPRPIRRAVVELSGTGIRSAVQSVTDDQGRYAFEGLLPGRYSIGVSKSGYVRSYHGARRPWRGPGAPIDLEPGAQRRDLITVLQRGGAVTGRIVDDQGQPIPNVSVQLFERRSSAGAARLTRIGAQTLPSDDRGVYRVYGLAPGEYLVAAAVPQNMAARLITREELQWASAVVQSGRAGGGSTGSPPAPPQGSSVSYSRAYFPGTADAALAVPVTVAPGQERDGADIAVRLVPTARVSGTIQQPDGTRASSGVNVMLRPRDAILGEPFSLTPRFLPQSGQFEFAAVEPGTYVLTARAMPRPPPGRQGPQTMPPPRPAMTLWAETVITVNGVDLEDVGLRLEPGTTISGTVVFEGQAGTTTEGTQVNVQLSTPPPATAPQSFGAAAKDGRFEIAGVIPGLYRITATVSRPMRGGQPPAGPAVPWMPAAILWNGREVLDGEVEVHRNEPISDVVIRLNDEAAELSGRILDGNDKPVTDLFVMAFTADSARWRQGSSRVRAPARPGPDGRFRFSNLTPGDYFLAALADFDSQDLYEPSFLEQVAQAAIRLTIAPRQKAVQDIRVR
jgi:protocatechuate 3,4-dioxygenase beta subunit